MLGLRAMTISGVTWKDVWQRTGTGLLKLLKPQWGNCCLLQPYSPSWKRKTFKSNNKNPGIFLDGDTHATQPPIYALLELLADKRPVRGHDELLVDHRHRMILVISWYGLKFIQTSFPYSVQVGRMEAIRQAMGVLQQEDHVGKWWQPKVLLAFQQPFINRVKVVRQYVQCHGPCASHRFQCYRSHGSWYIWPWCGVIESPDSETVYKAWFTSTVMVVAPV